MRYQNFSSLKRHLKEQHHITQPSSSADDSSVPVNTKSLDDYLPKTSDIEDASVEPEITLEEIKKSCLFEYLPAYGKY